MWALSWSGSWRGLSLEPPWWSVLIAGKSHDTQANHAERDEGFLLLVMFGSGLHDFRIFDTSSPTPGGERVPEMKASLKGPPEELANALMLSSLGWCIGRGCSESGLAQTVHSSREKFCASYAEHLASGRTRFRPIALRAHYTFFLVSSDDRLHV